MTCDCRPSVTAWLLIIGLLLLSGGLLGGSIYDGTRYDSAVGELTSVTDCSVYCSPIDTGGGGGGGGGDKKRSNKDEICSLSFACNAQWTYNGTTYTGRGYATKWIDERYEQCSSIGAGTPAAVFIKKSDPDVALDVQPSGSTRLNVFLVVSAVLFGVVLIPLLGMVVYCLCCVKAESRFAKY